MTDQHIWDHFYMNKPTETGNWYPEEFDQDMYAWVESAINWVLAVTILIVFLSIGAIAWMAA